MKRPRAAKASTQDPALKLRSSAHAWLSGSRRARAAKKEPRAARASRQDPALKLRSSAHAWLSGSRRARAAKKEPRAVKPARRTPASKQALVLRLRASAHAWLTGARRARAAKKEPRGAKAARPDPIARLRAAAWAQLGKPGRGGPAPSSRATNAAPAPTISAVARKHLKGVIEALIFASERPIPARELARSANAEHRVIRELLVELVGEYEGRGFRLDEVAGGYVFRTSPAFAPFVRDVTDQKPVKMSRAQVETLAIVAYRQPITRPEVDDVRGVDSGAALKSLLERDLVRILGKKDEPGRPMLYGTTAQFLEFFGMKSLGDLPTLREFTELTEESRRAYERELGEEPPEVLPGSMDQESFAGGEGTLRTSVTEPSLVVVDDEVKAETPQGPLEDGVLYEAIQGEPSLELDEVRGGEARDRSANDAEIAEKEEGGGDGGAGEGEYESEKDEEVGEEEDRDEDKGDERAGDNAEEKRESKEDEDEEDEDEDEDEDEEDEDEEDEDEDEEDEDEEDEDEEDEDDE
jgi:segregation and condensation protein B